MEITRNLSRDGTFCPSAENFLGQIPAQALFFSQHQLRHPESIYLFSLGKLGEACLESAYKREARETGLPKDSVANVSQVVTVDEMFLTSRAGILPPQLLAQAENGLRLVLEL